MKKLFEAMLEKAKGYCRDERDLVHLLSSLEMAKRLLQEEEGNERIVIPAAILHDTGWHIFSHEDEVRVRKPVLRLEDVELRHKHEIESSNIARKILSDLNLPKEEIEEIAEIILWHDTRREPVSKEDAIVKDADKLSRYTPECYSLFSEKLGWTEREFFSFLYENIERWFYTSLAKFLARQYLLIKRLGEPEATLSKKLYETLIRLEGDVAKRLKENLEAVAIRSVKEKVLNVKAILEIYLANYTSIDLPSLQSNEGFISLATQKVGEGGYIGIIDRQTGRIIFHPDKRVINVERDVLKKEHRPSEFLHGFYDWHDRAIRGDEFYSYYQGMNMKGEVIDKFQYAMPLNIKEARWSIVAAADYDEFFRPINILSHDIVQSISSVSLQIGGLANLFEEEKERLDVTLRSIGDGVIVANTKGLVVLLNKVAEELTGWKEKDALAKHTSDVFYIVNEQTRERCEDPVEKVISSGMIVGLANNTLLIGKDGQERIIADSGAPIYDAKGNILGVVMVFRDITEKKRMEERLKDAERLSTISQIAAEAAHEVRNPLQVITNGLYLLKEILPENDMAQKTIHSMENATFRATGFINDLLDISRPIELKKTKVDLNYIIKEALDELPPDTLSEIEVREELGELPNILGDTERLKQVIVNLIKNATEAMEEVKSKKLKVKSEKEGDFVRVSISDNGPGIEKENLARIFDPFYTVKAKGIGLGLSVCLRFVEEHSGKLEVESEVGVGTRFVVSLPIEG